jgi:hypothetical protein
LRRPARRGLLEASRALTMIFGTAEKVFPKKIQSLAAKALAL